MALVDDFKARFPVAFNPLFTDAVVDQYIPILTPIYPSWFVGDYDNVATDKEAILNLLGHLMWMEINPSISSGFIGAVSSKKAGDVQVSYQNTKNPHDFREFFGSTKYGARFLMIIKGRNGAAAWA